MSNRTRSPDAKIEAAMAALGAGRLEGLTFDDVDVLASVWITDKEQDRYFVASKAAHGGGREEWRSGGWIRSMLERGHWLVVGCPPDPGPAPGPATAPAAAGAAGPQAGIRVRRPLRGGHVELALPEDVTPEEAAAALGEIERLAVLARSFA